MMEIRWRRQFKHAGGVATNAEPVRAVPVIVRGIARWQRGRRRGQHGARRRRWRRQRGRRWRGNRRGPRRWWRWWRRRRQRSTRILALFRPGTHFVTLGSWRLGRSGRIQFRRIGPPSGSFIQQYSSRVKECLDEMAM